MSASKPKLPPPPPPPPDIIDAEAEALKKTGRFKNRSGFLSTVLNRGRQTGSIVTGGSENVG